MAIGVPRPLAIEKPQAVDLVQAARYFGAHGEPDAATLALLQKCAVPLLAVAMPRAVWLLADTPALIRCQTCVSAYIGAAFLCSGTVTDPQKEYNLEFLTARTNLARDFEALLAEHEFAPHRTRRNGVNLVYVKNSANLERLLRFMGAAGAAEEIHAQKAFKQVRNQTNRQTNCDTANLGKTARANAQTLRAIRYLQENDALETLPEVLQQAAAVRLQYPDLSLTALCGCFDPAVSKSGLSHRMKKLEALADALRQRVEKGQEAEP